MTKIIAGLLIIVGLSACTTTEKTAAGGALVGAGAGALVGGTSGAVAGAVVGGVVGTVIGKSRDGRCIYRDARTGRTYRASC